MIDILKRYMTVSIDVQPEGFAFQCWISVDAFWSQEVTEYPHVYTYVGGRCTWFIHSNIEMTSKMVIACGEQADRLCASQSQTNKERKLANR